MYTFAMNNTVICFTIVVAVVVRIINMNTLPLPQKTGVRRQGSSDRTSSAYDALRFLRTTNKWGEPFD